MSRVEGEIYTVGHSNGTPNGFIELLRKHGVEAIVDVRSAPYSQYTPHFNREAIAEMLQDAGIIYVYAGEYLGGRPQDPTCYKHGRVPTGKVDYLKLVDYAEVAKRPWFQKGISKLIDIAGEHRTAIMCSEEDPRHCHRYHLITPALERLEHRVMHLRSRVEAGKTDQNEPQQMSMF
ncbi:MAG: DUF488 domain-containing protein [Chloroflexota bacterium]